VDIGHDPDLRGGKGFRITYRLDLLSRAILESGGKYTGGVKVSYNLNHVVLLSWGVAMWL
jgi:hypothetical protein